MRMFAVNNEYIIMTNSTTTKYKTYVTIMPSMSVYVCIQYLMNIMYSVLYQKVVRTPIGYVSSPCVAEYMKCPVQ